MTIGEVIEIKPTDHTFFVWKNIKSKYRDAIILIRQEDQYFTFNADAEIISTIMNIELKENAPLHITFGAGYSTEALLHAVINRGYRVALCDAIGR